MPGLLVETVDARDPDSTACLEAWCGHGQTVALLGSSGVGKSTLVNTLAGDGDRDAGDPRRRRGGATPRPAARCTGCRPAAGCSTRLACASCSSPMSGRAGRPVRDIVTLAELPLRRLPARERARLRGPAAIAAGRLDPERLRRQRKLAAEEARNSESRAERFARDRAFGKMVKGVMRDKRRRQELEPRCPGGADGATRCAAAGRAAIRSTSPITTRNGARRCTTTVRSTRC